MIKRNVQARKDYHTMKLKESRFSIEDIFINFSFIFNRQRTALIKYLFVH